MDGNQRMKQPDGAVSNVIATTSYVVDIHELMTFLFKEILRAIS